MYLTVCVSEKSQRFMALVSCAVQELQVLAASALLSGHRCFFLWSDQDPKKNEEWRLHFRNLTNSLTSLLVLLTTANNPDGMQSVTWSRFFIPVLYLIVCSVCPQWWSLLTPWTEPTPSSLLPSVSLVSRDKLYPYDLVINSLTFYKS